MSSSPRDGYQKLVNVRQNGGQHVEVYVPDTRRKMSPEAQARALARTEIKEQYKAAALAEEIKAVKKQRNKLLDNLAKTGKTPSLVVNTPQPTVLSGTPKTYVNTSEKTVLSGTPKTYVNTSEKPVLSGTPKTYSNTPINTVTIPSSTPTVSTPMTTTPSKVKSSSQIGNINYQTGNLNYSAPIGPLPGPNMGGFKNRPYNQRINYTSPIGPTQGPGLGMSFNRSRNYSAPIGPLPSSSMGGFQNRPFDQQINYTSPIGPTQGPGLGMSFNRSRNYSAPIGPLPSSSMGGFQNRPFDQQINYTSPIGPTQGPGLGMSFNRSRNYSAPIGPLPGHNMGGYQNRPYDPQINYSSQIEPARFTERPRLRPDDYIPTSADLRGDDRRSGRTPVSNVPNYNDNDDDNNDNDIIQNTSPKTQKTSLQQRPSKWTPETMLPGKTLEEVEAVYKQKREAAVKKGRTKIVKALDRAIVVRRKQFGASGKTPPTSPDRTPTGKTPIQTTPERNAEHLLPGKTEQAVRRVYAERRAAAKRKGNKDLVARLDRALPIRLQRLKTQGANVLTLTPEKLIPGNNLDTIEKTYKERRAVAVSKGRTALVKALDRAIIARRKQFGASPGKPAQQSPIKSPTGKTPKPTTPERNAEHLLPGKTEQAVRRVYAERRAAAAKKGNKELVARLDRALPVRLQRLKSQGANVFKLTPEQLLPGTSLKDVEEAYKQRRATAAAKGRTALVQAFDRAIEIRRKQLGGSSGKVPSSPERNAAFLLPAKTEQAVQRMYTERRASAERKGNKELVARLDRALPMRLQQIKSLAGKTPMPDKTSMSTTSGKSQPTPEQLIPGKTLAEVEAIYAKRRASAATKKRTDLVEALNKAIVIRKKQFAASPGKSPQQSPSTSRLLKIRPERLIPGKTIAEVEARYAKTRAAAVNKKNPGLVQALNRAIVVRKKELAASPDKKPAISGKVSPTPEQLLPGKTLAEVEAVYAKRRASAVAKKRTDLVQALNRAIAVRKKELAASPGKTPQQSSKVFQERPERLIPGKTVAEVESVYAKRRASAVAKKRTDLVQALNRAIVVRKKELATSPGKSPQQSAQEAKAKAEAVRMKAEAEKARAKAAEAKKSIEREIISTKRRIKDVEAKAKKASTNIDKAGQAMSAASAKRDTRKVERIARFSRKRQQNLRSAQEVRGKLITSLRGLEQKSARVGSPMLTQGTPMAKKPIQQSQSPRKMMMAQSAMAEKAKAQSAKAQSAMAEKAKAQSAKAQSAMAEKAKAKSAMAEKAKAQSAMAQSSKQKLEQEKKKQQSARSEQDRIRKIEQEKKKQQSARSEQEKRQRLEQDKRQKMAKAQSAKIEQAKRQQQIAQAQAAKKKQMIQARSQKMMRSKRR